MEPRVSIRPALHAVNPTLVHLPQAFLIYDSVGCAYRYEEGGYFCENHFPSNSYSAICCAMCAMMKIVDANPSRFSVSIRRFSVKIVWCKHA
jgi:hypothetical protein